MRRILRSRTSNTTLHLKEKHFTSLANQNHFSSSHPCHRLPRTHWTGSSIPTSYSERPSATFNSKLTHHQLTKLLTQNYVDRFQLLDLVQNNSHIHRNLQPRPRRHHNKQQILPPTRCHSPSTTKCTDESKQHTANHLYLLVTISSHILTNLITSQIKRTLASQKRTSLPTTLISVTQT